MARRATRDAQLFPHIYRLYTIGAYLEVRASLFTFGIIIHSAAGTAL